MQLRGLFRTIIFLGFSLLAGCATRQLYERPKAVCAQPSQEERRELERARALALESATKKYGLANSGDRFTSSPCALGQGSDSAACRGYQREVGALDKEYRCKLDPSLCVCRAQVLHTLGTVVATPFVVLFDILTAPIQLIIWWFMSDVSIVHI